jgi:Xaa-Pro aminopeptidase
MRQRIESLRQRIHHHGLDALLVSSLVNIRYLFGFTGSNALALIAPQHAFFFTDHRYTGQSQKEVTDAEIVIAHRDLMETLQQQNWLRPGMKIGIEVAHLPTKDFFRLKKIWPEVHFKASERLVEMLASIKDPEEIDALRQAGAVCGKVIQELATLLQPDTSERDISAEISYRTRRYGSEKDPFEPIVASGLRSALPHGISSGKKIASGELVIIDFGAVIRGYGADITRTFVIGEPDNKQKELASAVLSALQEAERAVKPGMRAKDLDKVARDTLKKSALDHYFSHSLGHGLGLNVHELPRIGERSDDTLQPGQVFTLEPGVYLPDVGGIRIEDDYLLKEQNAENLTPFPREVVGVG